MSTELKQNKPKKSSLISNLLKRVDGKSLAMKKHQPKGVIYFLESEALPHLKANKESLSCLSYEELEILISGESLIRESFTMAMFVLEKHVPTKKVEPKPFTPNTHIRSYKEFDRQGTSKYAADDKSKQQPKKQNKIFTKKR